MNDPQSDGGGDDSTPTVSILVVDDTTSTRDVLCELLEHEGYAVREAGDGDEALEAVTEAKPDLVILDDMMPGMFGLDALRVMRKRYNHEELPVISTSVGASSPMDTYQAGANAHFLFPFQPEDLLDVVTRVLRGEVQVPPPGYYSAYWDGEAMSSWSTGPPVEPVLD